MVAISAILSHSVLLAIVIGIIKTSGGIGNIKLSMNEIKPRKNFDFLWPAKLIDFLYISLNILKLFLYYNYKNEIINIGRMAELVDALDSKSNSSNTVRVRFSLCPPFYENR